MRWALETKYTYKDRFVVDAGVFESEREAAEHASKDERPRFKRETVSVPVFVCDGCGRQHTAELDEAGEPIAPEPCEHVAPAE